MNKTRTYTEEELATIELVPKKLTREEDIPSVEDIKQYKGSIFQSDTFSDDDIKDYLYSATMSVNDALSNAIVLIGGLKGISNPEELETGETIDNGFLGEVVRWQVETIIMDVAIKAMNFYEDFAEISSLDMEGQNEGTSKSIQGKVWASVREQFIPSLRGRLNATGIYDFVFKRVLPLVAKTNYVRYKEVTDLAVKLSKQYEFNGAPIDASNQQELNDVLLGYLEAISVGAISTPIVSIGNEATELFTASPEASQQLHNEQAVEENGLRKAETEFNKAKNVIQDANIQTNTNNIASNATAIGTIGEVVTNLGKEFRGSIASANVPANTQVALNITQKINDYPYLTLTAPNIITWNDTVDNNNLIDQSLIVRGNFDASGAGSTIEFRVYNGATLVYSKQEVITDGGEVTLLDKVTLVNGVAYTCYVFSSNAVRSTGATIELLGNTLGGGGASLSSEVISDKLTKPTEGINIELNQVDANTASINSLLETVNNLQTQIIEREIIVGGLAYQPTAPTYGTWEDLGLLQEGQAIIGGTSSDGEAKRAKWATASYTATSADQSNKHFLRGITTFDSTGASLQYGSVEGTSGGELYTNGGSYNKAYGLGVGLDIHVWKRIS